MPDYNPKEPMGLMYLKAALNKNGQTSEILDADILALTLEETVDKINATPTNIIGISVLQRALPSTNLLVAEVRKRGIKSHICCGGFTATLSAKHILEKVPEIDSIVLGDGELTFSALVKAISNGREWRNIPGIAYRKDGRILINPPATKADLNQLPWPDRSLLPTCFDKAGYATILASRGCYGVCTFCSNQAFETVSSGSSWRGRNPTDVVDEIEFIVREYNIRTFKFNDPNLFGPGKRGRQHVSDICNEIINRGLNDLHLMGFCRSNDLDIEIALLMKRAGFERILIGVETSSNDVLKKFRKGESLETINQSIKILRSVGIDIVPGFMIFNPYTTIETLEADIKFLETNNFMPILAKALRIFDGTSLQKIMGLENRLIEHSPLSGYHEYIVDRSIASIYMALKTMSAEWIDVLKKSYQGEIWRIKKSPIFTQRELYDTFNKMMYDLEKGFLQTLISWIGTDISLGAVIAKIDNLKHSLIDIELMIVRANNLPKPILNVAIFSTPDLAQKVYKIVTKKEHNTFPEKYRWGDD
ncbi:MAG: B12-binding domain-containing radical SAM protein [Candidatus Komeilibacteria bacterium]